MISPPNGALWQEVISTEHTIGTFPGMTPVELNTAWDLSDPKQLALAEAFRRGRTVMQAISYGHNYWELEHGLRYLVDGSVFKGRHGAIRLGTQRLLQLGVLSRVGVELVDETWSMPPIGEIGTVKGQMRRELGVEEAYQTAVREGTRVAEFPGVNDEVVVDAILTGRLTVGNPDQPDPVCWRA